ncbi:MAG: PQQ-like beta-propeller repeat protein [Myxococcota bacterium]|nr:PQQ-like beta-propeller repeat protein [Myxococcota bacterium]MDW8360895.1 PQQ-binding-like beta-propeller repeat protein [Myxococcales bacterium]
MNRLAARWLALLVGLATGGCAVYVERGAFSTRFPDNQLPALRAVLARQPAPQARSQPESGLGQPVAFVATHGTPRTVGAWSLTSGERLWTTPVETVVRPIVAGDLVLVSERSDEGERVVAIDARTGQPRWRTDTGALPLLGAARGDDVVVCVASTGASGSGTRVGRVWAVDASRGSERWSWDVQGVLGEPAVRGEHVFVPWDRQSIVVLELRTGREVARLRLTDDVLSFVFAAPEGVYYGGRGVYRLDERSANGTRARATYVAPPFPAPPGEPLLWDDGFVPRPGQRSARGRIRVYFHPAASTDTDAIRIAGDRWYFVYFRHVFAFAPDGSPRWARALPSVIAGAQALPEGLLTVAEDGSVRLLDAESGLDRHTATLGVEVGAVAIDGTGTPAGAVSGTPPELRRSLVELAVDPDNRLVPSRAYAVALLAALPDPEVTRDLLDLYAQRSMPSALRDAIAAALRNRRVGLEMLVEALASRYDFLEGTEGPPLEIIVPPLVENRMSSALAGLVRHMMDHETPSDVLPTVVRAVVELGDASVVPPLRELLRLYRADSSFAQNAEALTAAAVGLYRHGGPEGRQFLEELVADARTLPALAEGTRALFDAERRAEEARARAEAEAAARAAAAAAARAEAELPRRLSQSQINETFAPHVEPLRACILQELERNPRLAQVRFVFIVEGEGTARDWTYAPSSPPFVDCVRPIVEGLTFPRFRDRRQRAAVTFALRAGSVVFDPGAGAGAASSGAGGSDSVHTAVAQPWWVRLRGRRVTASQVGGPGPSVPWWILRRVEPPPTQPPTQTQPRQPTEPTRQPAEEQPWWLQAETSGATQQNPPPSGGPASSASSGSSGAGTSPSPTPPSTTPPAPSRGTPPRGPAGGTPRPPPTPQPPPPPAEPETPWWIPQE